MGLNDYHRKRNFQKSPEPKGAIGQDNQYRFVVQKHGARRLHYDFRIELNGVLKSWAVPKGPCLDPDIKRLAIQVEDHPIEYGSFEGLIPKGEYGAGPVMLWDLGQWEPLDENPETALQRGHLRFKLHAEKLKGRWDLIRFKKEDHAWFLIKHQDEYATSITKLDMTEASPLSIQSNQTLEEIANHPREVWSNKEETHSPALDIQTALNHLPKSSFPKFIIPQLATRVDTPPAGNQWLHEVKHDGYRIIAFKDHNQVRLLSRNKKDWTKSFQNIAHAILRLSPKRLILDGELVVLDENNQSSFQLLQNAIKDHADANFIYYAFDLLFYKDWDTQSFSLLQRKEWVATLLANAKPCLRYSDHVFGQGELVYQTSCDFALEGIISKKIDSRYYSGRSKTWLKVKCIQRQEFIIGGYTPPEGRRKGFGSLLLGFYDDENQLIYSGKVGTGFTNAILNSLTKQLQSIKTSTCPFQSTLPDRDNAQWVKPKLIAEVEFSEWTKDGKLRHPTFKGLREDKDPKTIQKEEKKPLQQIIQTPQVSITNPNKVLYPEENLTKGEIAEYYTKIAPYILPFLINRPLTLLRCPDGYNNCFYQKHFTHDFPDNLKSIAIKSRSENKENKYIYLNDKAGLLSLVQLGVLEIHPWGSTIGHLEKPDIITFDLDPFDDVSWKEVVDAAFLIKHQLEELNLESFVKTTGGKGLHVVVPITPFYEWDTIKKFAHLFAKFIAGKEPDRFVTTLAKHKRKGKIFLDYLRNHRGATAIAPYSTRAKAHAPIAIPIHWDELTPYKNEVFFTLRSIPSRLKQTEDPWKNFWTLKQSLKI
ncbi:DNA ligase D [Legionella impletisoli]|uniref:DNA ligase (ATP) n=1 Tax=Legionella impletisoli TaxID=343510 RepID=A0A917JUD4_9GAMM|nr:DNA ligase D [Legionella impletisoli]GGI81727.1 ATP-dependent DNA ligase [Legionella impletisoli]